jgi:hypothetical protein
MQDEIFIPFLFFQVWVPNSGFNSQFGVWIGADSVALASFLAISALIHRF